MRTVESEKILENTKFFLKKPLSKIKNGDIVIQQEKISYKEGRRMSNAKKNPKATMEDVTAAIQSLIAQGRKDGMIRLRKWT